MQHRRHGSEAVQAGFEVIDDLFREVRGFRQVVEVGEAVVLEPEEVQAGLVPGDEFFIGELPPTAVGVLLGVPRFLALEAVGGVVAGDELAEVFQA